MNQKVEMIPGLVSEIKTEIQNVDMCKNKENNLCRFKMSFGIQIQNGRYQKKEGQIKIGNSPLFRKENESGHSQIEKKTENRSSVRQEQIFLLRCILQMKEAGIC